ncbi:ovostatin-like [Apteryx mantelli]|uniref:Ovostatin-like n=1 Tax=Apteryx mantelli TaxID=2696672 RepID=A0ABM4DYK7_9AVES
MNIVQIEFPLTEKPILGNYKIIIAKKSGDKTNHSFLVEEYVLPKFDVIVTAPESLTVMDTNFTVKVCGVYTYGQPVEGKVQLSLESGGCLSQVFSSNIFELNCIGYMRNLDVKATVTEKGTGLQLTATWSISITQVMSSIQFENMDCHYRRGIPYFGQIKLVDKDNSPVSNEVVQLFVNNKNTDNFTTDVNGIIDFSIDTSEMFDPEISLKATYKTSDQCHSEGWIEPSYPDASVSVQCFYSWTNSFVRIEPLWKDLSCGQKKMITVHYVWNTEEYEIINIMNFYYVESVQLQFSEKQIRSAFNVSLVIEAAANSFCAVRAVDQSVLLLKSETELSAETVYSLHPLQDLRGYIFNGLNLEDDPQDPCVSSDNIFHNGLYYTPVMSGLGPDVYQFLRDMGMKFFTNSRVQQPVMCASETARPQPYFLNVGFTASTHHVKSSALEVAREERRKRLILETIREFFPETWIWDIVLINSTGKASFAYTIPDTITEWKASAFCVEDLVGFGISVPATLTAFQPFFVDLTLPYSIIQGENFLLRANVFNYLNHCMKVDVLLSDSLDYEAKLISPGDDGCVCAKQRKTYVWDVFPKEIGDVLFSITAETKDGAACGDKAARNISIDYRDTQIRMLLVEKHFAAMINVPIQMTKISSIFFSTDDMVSHGVALDLPTNVVKGSASASFSVVGDIMGTAMQDVQQLLRMPFGCGEQNMVLFAPNIYVLDYLNKTEQLSEEVKFKAIGYLVSRYQKQLSYKHPDGSYSVFGTKDKEGNIWLTVFVYKSSAQANRFIYIDANVQAQTLMWLASKQKPDGCFRSVGKLFNNALKGTVDDELSLSAYITIAMLEAGHASSYPVVRNSFFCLETASEKNISDVYTQALMAYAFCLAGKMEKCESFLRELQKSAKTLVIQGSAEAPTWSLLM